MLDETPQADEAESSAAYSSDSVVVGGAATATSESDDAGVPEPDDKDKLEAAGFRKVRGAWRR